MPCLHILLIESDPDDAALVRKLLCQAEGLSFDLDWTPALLPGLDRLAKRDVDVVLIDSSLPDTHGLDAIPALRMHAPAVPIVILSSLDDEAFALRALQIGAQDYLVKGKLEPGLLHRSLRRAIVRQQNQADSANAEPRAFSARVIGCVGAKGGVGTTTVACHASLGLKRQTGQRVLLADVNPSGGSVGFLTRAESTYSILDSVNDLLRLDQSFWDRVVSNGPGDLEVLPLAAPISSDEQIRPDRIRCLLHFLRSVYPWVVLDLGRLTPFCAALLTDLTDLLLVTTFDLAAISESRQVVHRLADLGFESRLVTLVVNNVPKMDCGPAREVSKMLGIPASVIVPEGSTELTDAKSPVGSHLLRLAANLAGIEEKPAAWKLLPFLSGFSGKNRQLKIA